MAVPIYKRLPHAHSDRLLIAASHSVIKKSRELLVQTEPLVASGTTKPPDPVQVRDSGLNLSTVGSLQAELHQLRQQQAAMAAELQHRTRNLIAVVRALANQTMRQAGSIETFRETFAGRLSALSRVQGLLSRSDQEPITLRALIEAELDALGPALRDRIVLEGPEVNICKAVVQNVALVLYELITTAHRFGALASNHGLLTVTWRVDTLQEGRQLMLDWVEAGLDAAQEQALLRRGYDRELIEVALPYVLGSKGRYNSAEKRLSCSIELPLTARPKDNR